MKNLLTLTIGIILVLILLGYMFTFQVGYDEAAVRATFRKATPEDVVTDAGLHWRLPWPIQEVWEYSSRLRLLETPAQQLQTADDKSIVVRTYVTWKIADPYVFYDTIGRPALAEEQIADLMSNLTSVISAYRLDQLVNQDEQALQLDELERQYAQRLQDELAQFDRSLGVEIAEVGVRRILLPEDISEDVFQQMRQTRETLAQEIRSTGEARAETIRSEAEATREIILQFAEARAAAIRAEGEEAASRYYKTFAENEEFAIFLRQIEALERMLAHNTTFILDADNLSMLELFKRPPGQGEDGDSLPATPQADALPEPDAADTNS